MSDLFDRLGVNRGLVEERLAVDFIGSDFEIVGSDFI